MFHTLAVEVVVVAIGVVVVLNSTDSGYRSDRQLEGADVDAKVCSGLARIDAATHQWIINGL